MRYLSPLFGVAIFLGAMAHAQGAPSNAVGSATALLPEGDERATFLRVCSGCHAPEIVAHQRHDIEGWNTVVYQMADQGAIASDAELEEIVAYLSRSFPSTEQP